MHGVKVVFGQQECLEAVRQSRKIGKSESPGTCVTE